MILFCFIDITVYLWRINEKPGKFFLAYQITNFMRLRIILAANYRSGWQVLLVVKQECGAYCVQI